ncbi:hypothetical protein MTP99_000090 [Tenebrio molitor]|jgi:hypothetical protein|nr:hypothetical protein MTP99_000090 [Tenebrio molitor]
MPGIILVAFLVVCSTEKGSPIPIVEYDKGLRYEEYIVEHEISASQAKNAALAIDLSSVSSPAGCQKCTKAEIRYCLGIDLISDHCCCDRRYHEVLPFIPHTCYLGTQICKPVVGDCAEYSRLRSCCCDKHALEKWKKKSVGVRSRLNKETIVSALMAYIVYILVYYHV